MTCIAVRVIVRRSICKDVVYVSLHIIHLETKIVKKSCLKIEYFDKSPINFLKLFLLH